MYNPGVKLNFDVDIDVGGPAIFILIIPLMS